MSKVSFRQTRRGPVLANRILRIAVRLDEGTLALIDARTRWAVVPRAATAVVFSDGSFLTSLGAGFEMLEPEPIEDAHGKGLALRLRCRSAPGQPQLALTISLYEDQPFAVLQSHLTNATDRPLRVRAFHVLAAERLRLGPDPKGWRFYKQGWQNWSPTLVLPCDGGDIPTGPPVVGPGRQPPPRPGRFLSELVTAIADPLTGLALTAGFISAADQFSQLWLDLPAGRHGRSRRALTAASYADDIELAPARSLSSERLLLDITCKPLDALPAYGDALAREMGAVPWPQVVSGWCSWYYYWQGISEEVILTNLEYLAQHRDELPVEYVQVDDGYQAGIGDWLTPNDKFPHGMAWLADQIHARGFKAGIWLAPFLMGANSRLWAEHPDWAVHYRPGQPFVAMINWRQPCYALDCTRPQVPDWLRHVFRTVVHDWGYDYLKLDFLYAAAVDGIRHDPKATRAQAYRRGLEVIRHTVSAEGGSASGGGDKFILGCGNPVGPSVGLVNGMRIGPDVAPFWRPPEFTLEPGRTDLSIPATLNGLRNILGRYWMHGRLWLNDPDCLLARDSETALTLEEAQTLATVIAMSGGMMLDSDALPRLSQERREIISLLLPPYGRSAVPLDLFEAELPRLCQLDIQRPFDPYRLLAVFNWDDELAEVIAPLPSEPTHAFDLWRRQYFGVREREILLAAMPPHSCKLLALRPALSLSQGRPQVVGSSFHFTQGALELTDASFADDTLRLSLAPVAKKRGELFLHLPPSYHRPVVEGADGVRLDDREDGLLVVSLSLRQPGELHLRFQK